MKLHNFLYIHLCGIPYAVNISVSRSWWWAKYLPETCWADLMDQ